MQQKPIEPSRQSMESVLRDFGIKPSSQVRENLRRNLEQEKDKYVAVERIHSKQREQDRDRE